MYEIWKNFLLSVFIELLKNVFPEQGESTQKEESRTFKKKKKVGFGKNGGKFKWKEAAQ